MKSAPHTSTAVATPAIQPILSARDIRKDYRMGESVVRVLDGASLDVRHGEFLAIEGRSGSGKSTLLHILGALDEADHGQILFDGDNLAAMPANRRSEVRNRQFGFVFQFYHLLPELNVLENAMLPAMVELPWLRFRARRAELRQQASTLLDQLGLGHRLTHRPAQLSGGERQRVAIARALMNKPRVLFADEPTGNLDAQTGRQIMDLLESLHASHAQTIVMVTHDRGIAREADRVMVLREGKLQQAGP